MVAAMQAAGAILIGKTNLHELGVSPLGLNMHYGVPRNPHNPDCFCGGSSSGSAAVVAAGLCPFAIGVSLDCRIALHLWLECLQLILFHLASAGLGLHNLDDHQYSCMIAAAHQQCVRPGSVCKVLQPCIIRCACSHAAMLLLQSQNEIKCTDLRLHVGKHATESALLALCSQRVTCQCVLHMISLKNKHCKSKGKPLLYTTMQATMVIAILFPQSFHSCTTLLSVPHSLTKILPQSYHHLTATLRQWYHSLSIMQVMTVVAASGCQLHAVVWWV